MSDDLNTEIKIGADASGVEAGVGRAKRSLADLGAEAIKASREAAKGVEGVGDGGDKAAKKIESATRNIVGSLQRQITAFEAGEKGTRSYQEAMAKLWGIDPNVLKPLLDRLEESKAKAEAAARANVTLGSSYADLGTAAGLAARAVAAIGIGASVGEFVKMADASTNVASRLGLVTSSAAELASVQQRLFSIAQSSRVSFTDLVGTYAQVARSTKDLGVSQTALLGVIQTISQAVTISGGSAASAQAALTQLSQGFASGALRGEELNSILEQTPRLAQALADGLGVGVGKLRELGQAGELTSEKVLGALEKSAAGVAAEFGKMAVTVERASTNAANSVMKLVGAFDKLVGVTSVLGGAIQSISKGTDWLAGDVEKLGSQGPLRAAAQEVLRLDEYARSLRNGMKNGVFNPNAEAQLARVNAQLAEAKARFRELDQQLSGIKDPRDQTGFTGRGASYANEAARQAKLREDANAFRLKQAGVPASYLKDMEELIRLNQAGVIVGKEYTDALKAQQDLLLKKTTTVRGSAAAANAEQNAYESLIASIRAKIEADNLEIAGGAALTESRRIRIKLDQDLAAGRVKLSAQNERAVRLALEELSASEASALAAKTLAKANLDAAASREKYLTSLSAGLDKIQADIAAQIEATERMGLSKEAIAELDAAKLEMLATDLELQAIKAMDRNLDQQTYDALKKQAAAYRELGIAKKGGAAKEAALDLEKANAEAAKKAQEDWERASEQINQSLTDALMRGFESGKDFAKNLRDTVVNMFKTMVLRPVISAVLSPISGALTGAFGLAGAANAATGAAGGGGLGGLLNAGSSIYSALTNGISSSISSAFSTFAGSSVGQSLGLSNSAAIMGNNPSAFVPAGGQLTSMGSSIGAGLGMLGSGLAGYGISSAISNGYTTGGNTVNVLSGIASAFFGPIAGVVGGLTNRAFGRKLKDSGIEGTLGGTAGFEGSAYDFYKGGWFRSDKTKYKDLDPTVSRGLSDAFKSIQAQVGTFATVLGLNADKVATFTTDIKVSFKGLDEAGIQKALQDALATGSNELAQQVLGSWQTVTREVTETLASGMDDGTMQTVTRTIEETTYAASEFARDGEQAIDTLARLATSLYTVNDIWKNLGYTVYEASLAGADAASKMADAFGGLEAMAQATGAYFQNFYSAEEQRAAVERQLNEALGKLNLQLPDIDATDARAQYRALAEAQDRNTEAGREAYVVLLQLSGAFASVTAESETAAAAAARLADEQAKAAEAAARASEEAARRAEAVARERYGLETQLMQLLGDTAGLRKREIEALDASNRALQEHIYAIEDARAAYEKSITAAQSAYSVLESSVGRDRSALQSALDAERDAISARYKLQQDGHAAQISAAQSAADKMRGIASMLSGALGRMVVESPALDSARLQSARGVIGAAAASSNVMAPGLEAALSVVAGDVRKMYGRWEDFAFDQGVTAGQTAALSSAAQSQLSGYESIVSALKAQDDVAKLLADAEMAAAQERFEVESKKLDAQLEQGKSMLDRLLGIEEGTLSSVEALARLTDAVNAGNAALQAQRAAEAAARAAVSAGAPGKASGIESALWAAQESAVVERLNDAGFLGSIGLDAGNLEAALADAAFWAANGSGQSQSTLLSDALGRIGGMDGYAVVSAAVEAIRGSGSLLYDNDAINFSGSGYHDAEKMRELERLLGIHGSHAGGLAYVPFDGYRAELHKGERVLTQDEARVYTPPAVVASMLRSGGAGDDEILAELRSMRQRLEAIEAASNATAGHTAGTDRKLARVIQNDAIKTETTV